MLAYHPAFDLYHCAFRLLRLLDRLPKSEHDLVQIRIFDFYMLFPMELQRFEFPRALLGQKKQFQRENRFERIEDPKRILARLEPFQISAMKSLSACGLIEPKLLENGKIKRTSLELPAELRTAIDNANTTDPSPIEFITGPFKNIDLYGRSGLKKRSDLFEYRYDPR